MGFETRYISYEHLLPLIIKQSLWDLKQMYAYKEDGNWKYNKAVPMGFETDFWC